MYLVQTREGASLDKVTIRALNLPTIASAKAKVRELRKAGFRIVQIDSMESGK